MAKKHWYY